MQRQQQRIRVGTSGWYYHHWVGPFYPQDTREQDFLPYYAEYLSSAEVNYSFYHLPTNESLIEWRDAVPNDFIFAIKASRYITHAKKLRDAEEPLRKLLRRISLLGNKLGPILFQLPPHWHRNPERLSAFLKILPDNYRYAIEFRDPSWFEDTIFDMLADYDIAFCVYDLDGETSPKPITTDFIYIRLHGPEHAYDGKYPPHALSLWAKEMNAWAEQGKKVYCYFDNDQLAYAVENARELRQLVRNA